MRRHVESCGHGRKIRVVSGVAEFRAFALELMLRLKNMVVFERFFKRMLNIFDRHGRQRRVGAERNDRDNQADGNRHDRADQAYAQFVEMFKERHRRLIKQIFVSLCSRHCYIPISASPTAARGKRQSERRLNADRYILPSIIYLADFDKY